jgi:hypothetical protein
MNDVQYYNNVVALIDICYKTGSVNRQIAEGLVLLDKETQDRGQKAAKAAEALAKKKEKKGKK